MNHSNTKSNKISNGVNDLILAINIGNSNIHFGIFSPSRDGGYHKESNLIAREKIPTTRAEQFFRSWRRERRLSPPNVFGAPKIISSVRQVLLASTHPTTDRLVTHWSKEVFGLKTLRAGRDFRIPMPVLVDEPGRVGVDRLLNTFAAYQITHKLTLVIDFGTAITFDIVSERGEFLGGVIAAGINTMARALHNDCALLPLIKPTVVDKAIGKNTEEAMQSGIYLGTVGLIKYLVEKITAELGKKPQIIATGGDAELLKPDPQGRRGGDLPMIGQIIPDLTLRGLVLSHQLSV
jgi:type III pantothenate kinase